MSLYRFSNNPTGAAVTTLSAGIDASVTAFVLATDTTGLPSAGSFDVLMGSELIHVAVRSGVNCSSCTRAYGGSTAAAHSAGDSIYNPLTAEGLLANPGPMTTAGDMVALGADLRPARTANLSWVSPTLTADAIQTGNTDTGPSFRGATVKLLVRSLTDNSYGFAVVNAAKDPTHYGMAAYTDSLGAFYLMAGLDFELSLSAYPSDGAQGAEYTGAWAVRGDLVQNQVTPTYTLGRASNRWLAVHAVTGVFSGALSASNLSGTNTGDQSLAAYLTSAAAAATYQPIGSYLTSVTAHNLLSATHADTLTDTVIRGDLLYGNSTPKWARLAKPSVLSGLSHDGTDVSWVTATGTGAPVRADGATLTTPTLGVAAASKVTISEAVGANALVLTGATQTSSFPVLSATQIWNASGTTFTGIDLNVTNTASASASRLLNLRVGGTAVFGVTKTQVILPAGTSSLPGLVFANDLTAGWEAQASVWRWSVGGTSTFQLQSGFIQFPNDSAVITWGASGDLRLQRPSAATLQLGANVNGAAIAQTIKAHNGVTGSDIAGANLQLDGGIGTGAGTISKVLIRTATLGSTGTTPQTVTTRVTVDESGLMATGYKSSDGTAGATGGPWTSVTVKNGLVVSGS